MSKIIFLSVPAHGHVNPTLPVVEELTRRGEEILYYDTAEFRQKIERAGVDFRGYPETILSEHSLSASVQQGNLANATVLMLQSAEVLLPFVLDEIRREEPDLILFDSLSVWGKMAATMTGVPAAASISHFVFDLKSSRLTFREVLAMLRLTLPNVPSIFAARSRLIRTYGKDAFPPGSPLFPMRDKLNIVFTARELQPPMSLLDDSFRFVGPSIPAQTANGDIPFDSLGETIIYISLGTIHSTDKGFYRQCFAAFKDYPAHFILSAGRETVIDSLGEIPPNFTVRNFVPQIEVLQHAKLFITHGGMNSIHEGLYFGVPLIIVPQQFEQLMNARCVEARGAALLINKVAARKPIKASELREAVETIMAQPNYRAAAAAVQEQLQATGGYRQAADEIQNYIKAKQN